MSGRIVVTASDSNPTGRDDGNEADL